jgi:hypothetical protein
MRRFLPAALLCLAASCGSLPIRNDPASTDYYGMEQGLVRIYRARFPVCGKPHSHHMRKIVARTLALPQGRAVVVDVAFETGSMLPLHGIPETSCEVFTENDAGFGFYDLKPGEKPDAADPKRIDIEVPKPVTPGTRMKFDQGEVILEAVEELVVPAGRFAGCIRVRTQFKDDANVFWFAPGVGMIRGFSESKAADGRPKMEFELVKLSRSAN